MITIVLPVSRDTFIKPVMDSINNFYGEYNLLVYVDSDLKIFEKWRNAVSQSKARERLCVFRNKKSLPDVSNILKRRKRIGDIHKEMLNLIKDTDYIFLTEDDTTMPPDTLQCLLRDFSDETGFVSGVQIGRWGFPYIGAWKVDDVNNPTFVESVPRGEGLQEVDTAGFYACLMKKETYLNGNFEPFEDVLGPDFSFGLSLRQQGLKNYINHDIKCGHLTLKKELTFENTKTSIVKFKKGEKWSILF
jgi:hypothetical protein